MHMQTSTNHHPAALPFLFLTEMWERFGFYVAQGLLVLYMTRHFGFSDDESFTISGMFAGLVYISPFLGGLIADRLLGFKTAIIWGGFFLVCGYALLAVSALGYFFYLALATIIIGNGLLKPNVSGLLGAQYQGNETKRESGFTIFYIGINIGAALSGLSGFVNDTYGWSVTFMLASIGMIIGLVTFGLGVKYLKPQPVKNPLPCKLKFQLFLACLLAVLGISFLLEIDVLLDWLLPITGIILLIFLVFLTLQQSQPYRNRMILINFLIISSVVFWTLFLQLFISANLYVDRLVNKNLFGIPLTTTNFYAAESVFIILLGPLFALLWQSLSRKNRNPSPVIKFTLGIFFAGVGFLVLGVSTFFPGVDNLINPLWIFLAYLFITIGELCLSPIGLSAITQLAPPQLVGMMMGIWFVATGFGGIFAGWLAKLSSVHDAGAAITEKLAIYQYAFFEYAYLAFFITILLVLVHFSMKKILRVE